MITITCSQGDQHAITGVVGLLNHPVLRMQVFTKPIRVNKAASDKRQLDVGANLFVGNLDTDVDEKVGPACAHAQPVLLTLHT